VHHDPTKLEQRPRPRVGELAMFSPGTVELLGDVAGSCDGYPARLPANERIAGEPVRPAHVIVLSSVGHELVVSRRPPQLLAELFRTRFREVASDEVGVYHVVREPGVRAKIALDTASEDLDFIENIFGADDGAIIRQIVADSGDPTIDMVPAEPEISKYVCGALAPTTVTHLAVGEDDNLLVLVLPDAEANDIDRMHVQLAADLVGWNLQLVRTSDHARDGWDAPRIMTASPRAPAPRP